MLHRLDKELDDVEQKVKTTMKVVDKDDDGLVTKEEVLGALGFLKEEMGEEDLQNLIERLDHIAQSSSTTDQIDFRELLDKLEGKEQDIVGDNWVPPAMRKVSSS